MEHAFEISSFLFFVGPMTLICVLYILIAIKLRNSKTLHMTRDRSEINRNVSGQTRIIRMLSKFENSIDKNKEELVNGRTGASARLLPLARDAKFDVCFFFFFFSLIRLASFLFDFLKNKTT